MDPSAWTTSVGDGSDVTGAAGRAAIDDALIRFSDRYLGSLVSPVGEAIRYGLLGGGKRFRGLLFLAAYRAAGGQGDASELAAAIEIVHAYSLVHDDLPCMDDDDMRRGRPTVHRMYGVAAATAAGLAMVPLAVRCVVSGAKKLGCDAETTSRMVGTLMRASGAGGMIAGQLLDLEGEGRALTLDELETIHRAKTGALISASAVLGGQAAGANAEELDALRRYGAALGLAFQIADDVLDVTGSTEVLGKTAGRDVALRKSTYPALLGIEGACARAWSLVRQACAALRETGLSTPELEELATFIVERKS